MAFKRKTYKGVYSDTDEVFVCDELSDLASLPADSPQGSAAFVIADSSTWMIDSSGQWSEVYIGGASGDVTLKTLNVSTNGTYNAQIGTAYSKVVANIEGGVPADPTDGKTHIWIRIDESTPPDRRTFYLAWSQSVSNGVTVDWGDGSEPETFDGTGMDVHEHYYDRGGEYEITLSVTSGTISFDSTNGTTGTAIYGSKSNANSYNRSRITRIYFGDDVTDIGSYTLQYCYSLKYVTISDDVTSIGNGTFHSCHSLMKVDIPDGVTSIGDSAFYYCYALESVTIPDTVTSIGEDAFYNCYALRSIEIPDDVTVLNQYVFHGCYNLTSVDIPEGTTQIGAGAFDSCYGLTGVAIPASVTSIGASAFSNCFGVKEYFMERTTPPTLSGASAFTGIASDCVIWVPSSPDHSILNAYKSATNWATYASKMQEVQK